jgi:formylglycine-generating enzyme required for sulfatase activity
MRHENPSAFRKSGPRGNLVKNYDTDLFPVDRVTRYHVDAFISTAINGLGEKDHRRYKFNIPTEAQWEYACRGGPYWSTKLYHIGRPSNKLLPHQANYWPEALRSEEGSDEIDEALAEDVSSHNQAMRTYRPTTVKSYPPNVLGLYDMHGNVGEWCKDLYMHAYHSRMFTDSTESLMTNYRRVDPQQGDGRPLATDEYVVRGGGFMSGEIGLEACARHHTTDINSSAYRRFPYLGFRVIMISR